MTERESGLISSDKVPSDRSRFNRKWLIIVIALVTVLITILAIILAGIPILIKKKLIPVIEKTYDLNIICEIRKIGFFSSEINDIKVSKGGNSLFESDQIRMKYYFFGLGGIREVNVSGLRLRFDCEKKKLEAPAEVEKSKSISSICDGINSVQSGMREFLKGIKSSGKNESLFGRTKIKISGGELYIVNAKNEKRIIPFNGEFGAGENDNMLILKINAEPFSGKVLLSGALTKNLVFNIDFTASEILMSEFSDEISGILNFNGSVSLSDAETKECFKCEIRNFSFEKGSLKILSEVERNARIEARLEGDEILFFAEALRMEDPLPIAVSVQDGRIKILDDSLEITSRIFLKGLEFATKSPPSFLRGDISLDTKVILSDEGWDISCEKSDEVKGIFAKFADISASMELDKFLLKLCNKDGINGIIDIKTVKNIFEVKGTKTEIPSIDSLCEIRNGVFSGTGEFADGVFRKDALVVSGLSCSANFASPESLTIESSISAKKIEFSGNDYGAFHLNGFVDKGDLQLKGFYNFAPAALEIPLEFFASFGDEKSFSFKANTPDFVKLKKFDLGALTRSMSGYLLEGDLRIAYELRMEKSGISSLFEKRLRNVAISNPDMGLLLEGVESSFRSEDLNFSRSFPSQRFFAKKLNFGKANFSDLELIFALEAPTVFFVERLSATCCGGNLHLGSVRIDSSQRKNFTIYFDRILLSALLSEFGVCEASGDGRVNGRIPVLLEGNSIKFDDAFFYSTPGTSGNIKVSKAGSFVSNIPKDGEQFSSIDLTLEALKDFKYDWSKISLNNDGDDLVAKLEFLGCPNRPLPFRFDKQLAAFVRVEANSSGSNFQEIKLDLNCRLPFNAIMSYINVFKDFFKEELK